MVRLDEEVARAFAQIPVGSRDIVKGWLEQSLSDELETLITTDDVSRSQGRCAVLREIISNLTDSDRTLSAILEARSTSKGIPF